MCLSLSLSIYIYICSSLSLYIYIYIYIYIYLPAASPPPCLQCGSHTLEARPKLKSDAADGTSGSVLAAQGLCFGSPGPSFWNPWGAFGRPRACRETP